MTVERYHFHCVGRDGDAVFDLSGRWVSRSRLVRVQADHVALALMAAGADTDWAGWQVEVYNQRGRRVMVRLFSEAKTVGGVSVGGGGRRWG